MTPEPTLASIPGILLRTVLRTIARLLLILVWASLLVTVTLLMGSVLLGTWRSPRRTVGQAAVNLALAGVDFARALKASDSD